MKSAVVKLGRESVNGFWRSRMELLKELGEISGKTDNSALESATKQYFLSHIDKDLFCRGILSGDRPAATGSLCLSARIPYAGNLTGFEGYICNIYTAPHFRKQGFASRILDEIINYDSQIHVKRLWLHSSAQGEKLYVGRGFLKKKNEWELFL